jgi:hypothetical protein
MVCLSDRAGWRQTTLTIRAGLIPGDSSWQHPLLLIGVATANADDSNVPTQQHRSGHRLGWEVFEADDGAPGNCCISEGSG